MCRLASFPPGFKRTDAIDIMLDFEKGNTDGTGSAFIRDGKFVVDKWALPLSQVLKRGYPFLSHMPYNGWTLAHVRAASQGHICKKNTHPFVINDVSGKPKAAFIHNGNWNNSDHKLVRMALSPFIKFQSDTDSEVASTLIALAGPQNFLDQVNYGGVYLGLYIDGSLLAVKTSGQLYLNELEDERTVLASEFNDDNWKNQVFANEGYYIFNPQGHLIKHKKKEWNNGYFNRGASKYVNSPSHGNVRVTDNIREELQLWAT